MYFHIKRLGTEKGAETEVIIKYELSWKKYLNKIDKNIDKI